METKAINTKLKGHARVDVADVLRGLAVMGIIILHSIEHFNFYSFPDTAGQSAWLNFSDKAIWNGLFFMFGGKAYAIFALLFGFSFFPYLFAEPEELTEYMRLLKKIKQELQHPVVDTYNLIVSVLYYLLVIINRAYAQTYRLPVEVPKNNYAFKFKDLLEKHIRTTQRVQEYADMLRVSRITLNNSVMAQFGVSAIHLLKQRLLEELKNELLFSNLNVSQLADEFHFSDPSHLMRFFKKETGKTFTQYLMNYKRGIYE